MKLATDRCSDSSSLVGEDQALAVTARIVSACLLAGIARPDAEDLAQDIWEWLVSSERMAMAALSPWIGAVILNFIRRFRRRRAREGRVLIPLPEGELLQTRFGSTRDLASIEARLFLERLAARAQVTDRRLLQLLLAGHTLSEAARRLGIRHGSEQFHLNRVREVASVLMNAGRRS